MTDKQTKLLAKAALFTALITLATFFFKVPSPLKGYLNLGDSVILLASWILPLNYAMLAAGIGAALADLLSGYVVYIPATFIIKALMALIVSKSFIYLKKHFNDFVSHLISGFLAEAEMVLGYFLFESFLYGIYLAAANIVVNLLQGGLCLAVGIILIEVFQRQKILKI